MAGTAEGAARARAARAARLAERRAVDAEVEQGRQQVISAPVPSVARAVAADGAVDSVHPDKGEDGQALARAMVDQLQPAAVRELASLLVNPKSAPLRLAAAAKLLDMGINRKAGPGSGGQVAEESLLARIGQALQLRQRAAGAVTVDHRAEAVALAPGDHSPKASDT